MSRFFKQAIRLFPFYYVLLIWGIHSYKEITNAHFTKFGIHPRSYEEWSNFLTGPLIHSDWQHLINNTYPLIICGLLIYFLLGKYSNLVFLTSYLFTGLLTFFFARGNTYHIGASGVAYSWAFLLAASGFFRKDRISLGLGLLVAMLYGSMIWGVLPIEKGVSWDGHLIGALTGVLIAYFFRNLNKEIEKEPSSITKKKEEDYKFEQFDYGDYAYIRRQKPAEEFVEEQQEFSVRPNFHWTNDEEE